MPKQVAIWMPDPLASVHEDAVLLAKAISPSFSQFVWEAIQEKLKRHDYQLQQLKRIKNHEPQEARVSQSV